MPNTLDSTGLTTATQAELLAAMTAAFQSIYDPDINVASDTPDGQIINIFIQSILDIEDLLANVYNSFNPDNAVGVVLDQRVAINGIQRQAGTFTVTPITVVTAQSVNLYGLDQSAQQVYTVADAAGNQWQLQTTELGVSAGTAVFNFQAALPGATTTTPNTITTQVTVVIGVTSVNNPTIYTVLGTNEESDAALRLRRSQSVSQSSQGYLPGLLAALLNIPGMAAAFVYENVTDTTDSNSVPGHSIWVITSGSAAASDIATAIYDKRNAGCGMKGLQTFNITQVNGIIFKVQWDNVIPINLFIQFTATSLNGINPPNIAAIRPGLVTGFVPGVSAEVNINALATAVQVIDPNTLVTASGFSTGQTQLIVFSGIAASGSFFINYNGNLSAALLSSDSTSSIQTKVQAVAGLSGALVTGSFSSAVFTFNLSAISNVAALIFVPIATNTLMTSGSVAITAGYSYNYSTTLIPQSKQYQFVVSSPDITILTPILLPATSQVVNTTGTVAFQAYGGYGAYTYSILTNNSMTASINATTGVYTAGSTGSGVTDVIEVKDVQGNLATATVTVT